MIRRRRAFGLLGVLLLVGVGVGISLVSSTASKAGRHAPSRFAALDPTPGTAAVARAATTPRSPRQLQQIEDDRAVAALAKHTWFVNKGGKRKREVALTFDDGPGPYSDRVLDVLAKYHVPATFFEVGAMIADFSEVLKRQIREGYVVGDHTEAHMNLAGKPRAVQLDQITSVKDWLRKFHSAPPHLFRAPYGAWDRTTRQLIKRMGMLAVFWSVDTEDWKQPGVGAIVRTALSSARAGAIILMHDAGGTRTQTIAALPKIIKGLRARGYTLVTVPRLIADAPPRRVGTAPLSTGVG